MSGLTTDLDPISPTRRIDGEYRAWLYTSLIDSIPLGSVDSDSGTIESDFPPDAFAYEFLDVSVQPANGQAHSGRSVFRVPLRQLLRGE